MTTKEMLGIDIQGLKELYGEVQAAKFMLDHFASRERNWSTSAVDRLLTVLNREGAGVSRKDVIDVLRRLEEIGCGSFKVGRHGHPSRFEWKVGMVAVGRVAVGEAEEVEDLPLDAVEDEGEWQVLEHSFALRPDLKVTIDLPADLTASEATRLAEFIKSLPFER